MDMTEKSGQPSMEEILASIRRIIAEEPEDSISLDFKSRPSSSGGKSGDRLDLDDSADFELPSMFRAPATNDKNGAPVKLLDALRATPQVDDSANARLNPDFPLPANPFLSGPANVTAEEAVRAVAAPVAAVPVMPAPVMPAKAPDLSELLGRTEPPVAAFQSLSSLRPAAVRVEMPAYEPVAAISSAAPVPAAEPVAVEPAAEITKLAEMESEPVVRHMVPFRDQRFSRITSASAQAAPAAPPVAAAIDLPANNLFAAALETPVAPAPAAIVVSEAAFTPPPLNGASFNGSSLNGAALNGANHGPLHHDAAPQSLSAAIKAAADAEATQLVPVNQAAGARPAAGGGIEDATAELLRPMLRQWLSENMPRMVEKALHIEVAESVKTGKKPGTA